MSEEFSPAVELARELKKYPLAAARLEASIAKQREAKRATERPAHYDGTCPHCTTPGAVSLVLNGTTFYRRREDCCDPAKFDAAVGYLRYSQNPTHDKVERVEYARVYAALKAAITSSDLLTKLHLLEQEFAGRRALRSALPYSNSGAYPKPKDEAQ